MKIQYLTEREVSRLTGRALSTLRNDRQTGNGFPYVKWGRFVRYRKQDVIEFMEARKVIPKNNGERRTNPPAISRSG